MTRRSTQHPATHTSPSSHWRAAVVGLALASLGAAALVASRPPRRALVERHPGRDVLLITIDTLRADAVGAYGAKTGATPWIDRLAARGVRFSDAHAHNVVTLPSHSNILTGRYPFEHGVRDNAGFRLGADVPTLAALLRQRGYRTGAFVSAFTLDSRFGLDRGFDVYDDRFPGAARPTPLALPERRAADTVAAAREWLRWGQGQASFCWIHLYDPHAPYVPVEPFASRYPGQAYAGEVAAADAALEPILAPILEGRTEDTLVVLTADHGESLGEHGERTHGLFAYESTLRVPLIVFASGLGHGTVVDTAAGHVDILPTVLDALAAPVPAGLSGRSLLPAVAGAALPPRALYFEALSAMTNRGWAPLYGVLKDGAKYIELPLPELYDLRPDPGEERNLVATDSLRREWLLGDLGAFRRADQGPVRAEESADTREALRALGYLASAAAPPKKRYTPDDDPKRLVDIDTLMETVLSRHREGDLDGAVALCREILGRRPDMPAALLQLALLERKRGHAGEAVAALKQAVALVPEDAGTAALLGQYLTEAGEAAEAVALLEPYVRRAQAPLDVRLARGIALAQLGRYDDALVDLEAVRAADGSNAMVHVQVGTVHLLRGRLDAARQAFEAALLRDPNLALAHHSLALVALRAGDEAEAVRRWEQALTRDPDLVDALLQLGSTLARRGRPVEARPYLERFLAAAPRPLYDRELAQVKTWLGPGSTD
jgi:arylsulfatase A-like enzyme/tetratricopeptide (TPR) repeat protein